MFRRAMDYLGLGADEVYDDSDQSVRTRRPVRGRAEPIDDVYDDEELDDDDYEEAAPPPRRTRVRDDSGVTVRGPVGQPQKNVKPLDAATVERFKSGQPVIMNMIATDPEEGRRIIDFVSGLAFGLNGSLERVSRGVFRITPNGVRIPRD